MFVVTTIIIDNASAMWSSQLTPALVKNNEIPDFSLTSAQHRGVGSSNCAENLSERINLLPTCVWASCSYRTFLSTQKVRCPITRKKGYRCQLVLDSQSFLLARELTSLPSPAVTRPCSCLQKPKPGSLVCTIVSEHGHAVCHMGNIAVI